MHRSLWGAALCGLLSLLLATGQAAAARLDPTTGEAGPVGAVPGASPRLTEADVSAWLDGFMPYAIARGDIAGAVVVVVKDGQVLTQRGYGYADVAARRPVDPDTTLFRPGSVSKLLTWTAIMQLVERGEVDLDTDINTYLDFKVPREGEPITLRHVLTHTTGLEERIKRLMIDDPDIPEPLGEYLKAWVPAQVFAPGTTPAYSNYATSLAGYIVERVSGLSFDDYIDQHILQPLGMHHSSFRQPLPAALQPLMSKGYALGSGAPKPFEMVVSAPAGSLSATGADMARFMLAHLQNATGHPSPILRADTAARMYEPQTVHTPPLNTMALGFYQSDINGRRVLSHGGDTKWFHSSLHLFLDDGVGLFVSLNSAGKSGATGPIRSEIFTGFGNRYFPPTQDGGAAAAGIDAATAAEHARLMASHKYESTRRVDSRSFVKLQSRRQVGFAIHDDGTISASGINATNGQPIRWREVAPFVWKDVASSSHMAAVVDDRGKVQHWSVDRFAPIMQFEPVPGWRSASWLLPLLQAALGSLALSAVAWPVAALVRRRYGQTLAWPPRQLLVRRYARIAAWSIVGSWIAWFSVLGKVRGFELDKWILLLSALGLVAGTVGAAVISWHAWLSWTARKGWPSRLWDTWLVLAALASLYGAFVYGLLSFSTEY